MWGNYVMYDFPFQGSHSAKVIAVVKTLMGIQKNDPGAKALVFSTVSHMTII